MAVWGDHEYSTCGRLHLTGIQPLEGQYRDACDALAGFIDKPDGLHRHVNGVISIHEPDCTFAEDDDDVCCCRVVIIPKQQGRFVS